MTPAERRQMMLGGPIVPTILTLAAPNVLNVAMQSLVSISDSWFVGQLGLVDLAALALVFPTQMALGQMSAGAMGGGISSSVARALGSGNRAGGGSGGGACAGDRDRHGGAVRDRAGGLRPADLRRAGRQRRRARPRRRLPTVLFLGCVAHWIANTLASVLRGTGDMKTPGYALVATAALQIPLTGALTLGWFGLPQARHRRPGRGGGDLASRSSALWMLSRLVGPQGGAPAALAEATDSAGARSATS